MEATQPTHAEEPPSERTKAILAMRTELLSKMQDVTDEVRQIKQIMRQGESRWAAFWRAVTQFIGDLKSERDGDNGSRRR